MIAWRGRSIASFGPCPDGTPRRSDGDAIPPDRLEEASTATAAERRCRTRPPPLVYSSLGRLLRPAARGAFSPLPRRAPPRRSSLRYASSRETSRACPLNPDPTRECLSTSTLMRYRLSSDATALLRRVQVWPGELQADARDRLLPRLVPASARRWDCDVLIALVLHYSLRDPIRSDGAARCDQDGPDLGPSDDSEGFFATFSGCAPRIAELAGRPTVHTTRPSAHASRAVDDSSRPVLERDLFESVLVAPTSFGSSSRSSELGDLALANSDLSSNVIVQSNASVALLAITERLSRRRLPCP